MTGAAPAAMRTLRVSGAVAALALGAATIVHGDWQPALAAFAGISGIAFLLFLTRLLALGERQARPAPAAEPRREAAPSAVAQPRPARRASGARPTRTATRTAIRRAAPLGARDNRFKVAGHGSATVMGDRAGDFR
jgi:hypothetical protein